MSSVERLDVEKQHRCAVCVCVCMCVCVNIVYHCRFICFTSVSSCTVIKLALLNYGEYVTGGYVLITSQLLIASNVRVS